MILIADSGSTKTEWALAGESGDIEFFRTAGYNPYFDREVSWKSEVAERLGRNGVAKNIDKVFYYGAGCDLESHKTLIRETFLDILPSAGIVVDDDLTGAARALFGRERGVALILGTGANAGLWDGETFIARSFPLGFLLGDHGSGAVLGLRLVKAWLDGDLSTEASKAFTEKYNLKIEMLKTKVYLKGRPNHYLAGFTPFLFQYRNDKTISKILDEEFGKLFDVQLKPLLVNREEQVRLTGSVAYFFRERLEVVARERGIKIDKVVRYPLKDLAAFHLRNTY